MEQREYRVKWCCRRSFNETRLTSTGQLSQGSVLLLHESGDLLLGMDAMDGKQVGGEHKIALDDIASVTYQAGEAVDAASSGSGGRKFSWRRLGQDAVGDGDDTREVSCIVLRLLLLNGTVVEISDMCVAEALSLLNSLHSKWEPWAKTGAERIAVSPSAVSGIDEVHNTDGTVTGTVPESRCSPLSRYIASRSQAAEPAPASTPPIAVPVSFHGSGTSGPRGHTFGPGRTNKYAALLQGRKTQLRDDAVSCAAHTLAGAHRNIILQPNGVGAVDQQVEGTECGKGETPFAKKGAEGGQLDGPPLNYPDASNPGILHDLRDPVQRIATLAADGNIDNVDDTAGGRRVAQSGVHLLRMLREKTSELERTKAELFSLHEKMDREAEQSLQQEQTLLERFTHLTPSQRALLNFEALLEPTITVEELRHGLKGCPMRCGSRPSSKFSSLFTRRLFDHSFTLDHQAIQVTMTAMRDTADSERELSSQQRHAEGSTMLNLASKPGANTPDRRAAESPLPQSGLHSVDSPAALPPPPPPSAPPPPPPPPPLRGLQMVTWLFQVTVIRLEIEDLQLSGGVVPENSRITCRMVFDGKTVILLPTAIRSDTVGNPHVSFRYRIQTSTLSDLVATLSQRTVLFEVLLGEDNMSQIDGDTGREEETVAGVAIMDILRLVQHVGAQYQLGLTKMNATGVERVGTLSICLLMEQVGDVELQLKALRASGLDGGEYQLQCHLSSGVADTRTEVTRSKLSVAIWTGPIVLKAKFHGTLRALAAQKLELALVKLQRNGIETLISSYSLGLVNIKMVTPDSVKEIPFCLKGDTTLTSLHGVLQLIDLPVLPQRVRQLSENRFSGCKFDGNGGGKLNFSNDPAPSYDAETSTSVLRRPIAPSGEPPMGSERPRMKIFMASDDSLPPRTSDGDVERPAVAQNRNRGSSSSSSSRRRGSDHTANVDRNTGDAPSKRKRHVAATHGGRTKEKVHSSREKTRSGGVASVKQHRYDHPIFSHSFQAEGIATGGVSPKSPCAARVHGVNKGRQWSIEADASPRYEAGRLEMEDAQEQEECKLRRELARWDKRVATLLVFLKDLDAPSEPHQRLLGERIIMLELWLSELCGAEDVLLRLADSVRERLQQCSEKHRESEIEYSASKVRLNAYAEILSGFDRRMRAAFGYDEKTPAFSRGKRAGDHPLYLLHSPN